MKKLLFFIVLLLAGMSTGLTAQVNGIATDPVVSEDPANPVYFYIESASDSSFVLAGYSGDFRGNVIISPDAPGKLIHNKPQFAPTADHTLWAIVTEFGVPVLKNKATGFYMTGGRECTATGSASLKFFWTSLGSNQFLIRTNDAASYTCTWKNNLCDRYSNQGLVLNSLAAWYFIVANPEQLQTILKKTLQSKLAKANNLLTETKEGTDFGQYSAESRSDFAAELENSQAVYDYEQSTIDEINLAIRYTDMALEAYKSRINTNMESLVSTNPDNYRWYWIRSYGYDSEWCFNKVISAGSRTVGERYTYEAKTDPPADNQLFRFELTEDKTKVLSIIDRLGNHMSATGYIAATSTEGSTFSFNPQDDGIAFWIKPTTVAPLRANETGNIDNWLYLAGGASSWVFDFAKDVPKIPRYENPRTITVQSANETMGKAYITGTTDTSVTTDLEKVSVTAEENRGYFFTRWTNTEGDSISTKNPYIYAGEAAITLVANFEPGYYRDMQRYYTAALPYIQSADRYLTDVTALVNDVPQIILSGVNSIPNPVDSLLPALTLTGDAVIDCTIPQIVVPLATDSFDMVFVGSSVSNETFKWTQQNAFIDWNKDFDFLDENEAGVRNSESSQDPRLSDPEGYIRRIGIPAGTPEGVYRMRVIYHEPSSAAPDWSVSIWTNNYIRNGTAYDFDIKLGAQTSTANHRLNNASAYFAGEKLRILNAENSIATIRDVTGRWISTGKVTNLIQEISLQVPKGVYLVTLQTEDNKTVTLKVIR